MSKTERILAICVNWNGGDVLSHTIESLTRSDYPHLDIWVVDNASTDGSADSLPSQIRVMRLNRNLGYGGALNSALKEAIEHQGHNYDYFLLLNNDLTFSSETISSLLSCALQTGSHALAPKTLLFDNTDRIEAAWGKLNWTHVLVDFKGKGAQTNDPRWRQSREVQILLGNALLISRELIERIGYFDQRFFMYHEEVDLLYRAWLNGLKSYYCCEAAVIHRGGYSLKTQPLRKVYWTRKNTVLFLRKYRVSALKWFWFFVTLGLSLLFNLVTLQLKRMTTICSAVIDGFRFDMSQDAPDSGGN